ncbi:MAG: DMT family transporter [Armatimonadota bacterium]|jgi:drug/metabolite transporter (DMT)-like permease
MSEKSDGQYARAAGFVAALLSGGIMGISWPLQKFVLSQDVVGPASLHWLNVIGLFAIVAPIYLVRYRGRLSFPGFHPAWLLLLGAVACVMHFSRNFGLAETSATTAAIVESSEVVFVFTFSYLLLRKPVRPIGWIGAGLVLYGLIRVAMVGTTALNFSLLGVIALVITGLTIAVNALLVKTKLVRVPSELIILGSMAVQLVVFSVAVPSAGLLHEVSALRHAPLVAGLVLTGSVVWGTRLVIYYFALKRSPMWAVRILALSGLPVATLADLLVLRAPVTGGHVVGLVAAMVGAALVILAEHRQSLLQNGKSLRASPAARP